MKQLGILDSAFINLEQKNTPQHIGGFGIYDPSTAPGGFVRFKEVIANVEQRLKNMPVFRTRLREVPMGLDRPYWQIDKNFDVEFHLRHIALPQPGDWRQLCIQVARLHARPLDMNRPLWECYVIEGLDNIPGLPKGAFAIYTKMHHSLVDGAGSQSFMAALHDLEANPTAPPPQLQEMSNPDEQFTPAPLSTLEVLGKAAVNNVKSSYTYTKGGFKLAGNLVKTAAKIYKKELPAYPVSTPRSRFDQPVSPYRVFDAASFQLDEIKMIKNATGTTINDVAIAIVSGAVRKYLIKHDELPEESLACNMPVNMRARVGETEDNNQLTAMMSEIHTNIGDPLERLEAIKSSISDAKQFIDTPLSEPLKLAGIFNPSISKSVSKWYIRSGMTKNLPLGTCGVVTNVMGPPFPLFSAGAKLVQYYCLGLLTPGGGLFQAIFSMNGNVTISMLADRNIMPDPAFYKECLEESFAELKAAVDDRLEKATRNKAQVAPKRRTRKASASASSASAEKAAEPQATAAAAEEKPAAKKAPAKRKAAAKKAPAKKAPAKKAAAKKAPAKKAPAKRTAAAKKVAPKAEASKPAAKAETAKAEQPKTPSSPAAEPAVKAVATPAAAPANDETKSA